MNFARGTCRSCEAPLLWGITPKGKRMPLDPAPSVDGNVVPFQHPKAPQGDGVKVLTEDQRRSTISGPRYLPHHSTCPQGNSWKRAKK